MAGEANIAVVIPTYGRPQYLSEALQSVLRQTIRPDQIIVVDGRGDAARVVAEFGAEYVLATDCATAGALRNRGVARTNARFLAFLDDDDWWLPNHLQQASSAAADYGLALAAFLNVLKGQEIDGKTPPASSRPEDWVLRNLGATGSNIFVARARLEYIGGFDEALPTSEDKDLMIRLLRQDLKYGVVRRATVRRRLHAQHLSAESNPARLEGLRRLGAKHQDLLGTANRLRLRRRLWWLRACQEKNRARRALWVLAAGALGEREVWVRVDPKKNRRSPP